jgi:predicted Zn-dependent protease
MAESARRAVGVTVGRGTWVLRAVLCWAGLAGGFAVGVWEGPARGQEDRKGPGRRPQRLALTPEQELELGRKAYRKALQEAGREVLPPDSPEAKRVRRITDRIIKAAQIEPLQREINLRVKNYRFEWEVNVLRDQRANALCLPGGKTLVFTGIFKVAQNDDQLATVLSHEMAHALAHHASERVARGKPGGGVAVLWNKTYDRQQEAEADHIGVFLMTFAGYDPEEAVHFWERMGQAGRGKGRLPEILSDHPSDAQRIRALAKWVPAARAGKKAYDEGRVAPAPGRR